MSIQIQKPNPDQLWVTQGRETAGILLGVVIALPGLYLYYYLVWGLYAYAAAIFRGEAGATGLLSSLPGLMLTLLFGACFLLPGLFMGAKESMILDRQAQTITQVQNIVGYRRQKLFPLAGYTLAEIDFAAPKNKPRKLELFDIQVRMPKGAALHIATVTADEVGEGIALTRQIADFLGVQYHSQVDDWAKPSTTVRPRIWHWRWWIGDVLALVFLFFSLL